VQIGPAGDAYEREADRVSADVASGRSIVPSAISPIGSLSSPVGQRAAAPDDKKKDEKPKAPAVQKAAAPEDKKTRNRRHRRFESRRAGRQEEGREDESTGRPESRGAGG
jgi:hypothetical protein